MRIIFVYASKCARMTLKKVLNNGGLIAVESHKKKRVYR